MISFLLASANPARIHRKTFIISGLPLSNNNVTGGEIRITRENKCEPEVLGEIIISREKLINENKKTQKNGFWLTQASAL